MLYKTISVCALAAMSVLGAGADELVETCAYYSTNPGQSVGVAGSINIDGNFSDWSESMIIATCGANDMATAFKGSHENNVLDMYTLYASWDDQNIYLAWQMCNTGDVWAREGDGPLTDYGKIGDVPMIVALSVDPSKPCMSGKLTDGRFIWCDNSSNGVAFTSHVDHLLFFSAKPGQGTPSMFVPVNDSGDTDYTSGCKNFSNIGISYNRADGFQPSHLWRQRTTAEWSTPTTLVSDPSVIDNIYDAANYDNLLAGPVAGLKPHDTKYDTFFEIKIPYSALGINRQWLEANGIGVRVLATRGESAIDCIPWDPSMMDNCLGQYAKDPSTTHEKDDIDNITYALASVGKIRDVNNIDPIPNPDPNPGPDPNPTPDDGKWTVYFRDNVSPAWSSVKTWIWDGDNTSHNYTGGSWPGAAMTATTLDGQPTWVYIFTTTDKISKPMVIFNNGSGDQTADLPLVNNGIYDRTGCVGQAGVADIAVDPDSEAVYYNLQGIRVAEPVSGNVYIVRTLDGNAAKVLYR